MLAVEVFCVNILRDINAYYICSGFFGNWGVLNWERLYVFFAVKAPYRFSEEQINFEIYFVGDKAYI